MDAIKSVVTSTPSHASITLFNCCTSRCPFHAL